MELMELMEVLGDDRNLTSHLSNDTGMVEMLECTGRHGGLMRSLCALYLFTFLLAAGANMLLLWGGRVSLCVGNVAVADLMAACTLPLWAGALHGGGVWSYGYATCWLAHTLLSVGLPASIYFRVCVGVNLCLGSVPCKWLMCGLIWMLAVSTAVPELYFLSPPCRPVFPSPILMAAVQFASFLLTFVLPLFVMSSCYLLLPPRGPAARLMMGYIFILLLCWGPFYSVILMDLLTLLQVLPFSCRTQNFLGTALQMTQGLAVMNCCLDPLLHTILTPTRTLLRSALTPSPNVRTLVCRYSTRTGMARLLDPAQNQYTVMSASQEVLNTQRP